MYMNKWVVHSLCVHQPLVSGAVCRIANNEPAIAFLLADRPVDEESMRQIKQSAVLMCSVQDCFSILGPVSEQSTGAGRS